MRYTGAVKVFYNTGFGFIACDDPNATGFEDLYFHCSELPGKRGTKFIEDGTLVSFELGAFKTPANVVAKRIQPLDGNTHAANGGNSDGSR